MSPLPKNRLTAGFGLPAVAAVILLAAIGAAPKADRPALVRSTDPALRLKGYEAHLEMQRRSPYGALHWSHIGPTNVSGRVTDIAVVEPKGKSYTLYAATASGGVWKTVNEGTTWEPIFEQAASTTVGDIALAPSDPKTVWVGTGEANIFRSSQAGIGVFKSVDAGMTWSHMGLADTYTISRIIVHPQTPDIVYVAAGGHEWTPNAERGVYKTTDGGGNWAKVLFLDTETGASDLPWTPTRSTNAAAGPGPITFERPGPFRWDRGQGRLRDRSPF